MPVLAAYDVEHERPWDWQVPVYFWTKSLSTGVLALPAVAIAAGWLQADKLLNLVLVMLALVFMGITVGAADLRPVAARAVLAGALPAPMAAPG